MSQSRTCSQCNHISQTCSNCGHMSQTCSNCGHNSPTCNDRGENNIMLFGVQLTRGTNNNNNNSQYQQPSPQVSTSTDANNVFGNVIHPSAGSREYKQVNESSWTKEEHMRFLIGLRHKDKGKWKIISEEFVKTRTPTQVVSHAQKHYLLLSPNQNRRRGGKFSVFDLTIGPEVESSTIMEDKQIQQETVVPLPQPNPTTYQSKQNDGSLTDSPLPICLVPVPLSVLPLWVDLNDNGASSSTEIFPLSLKLQSLPPSDDHSGHSSPYAGKSSGGSGDSITGL